MSGTPEQPSLRSGPRFPASSAAPGLRQLRPSHRAHAVCGPGRRADTAREAAVDELPGHADVMLAGPGPAGPGRVGCPHRGFPLHELPRLSPGRRVSPPAVPQAGRLQTVPHIGAYPAYLQEPASEPASRGRRATAAAAGPRRGWPWTRGRPRTRPRRIPPAEQPSTSRPTPTAGSRTRQPGQHDAAEVHRQPGSALR